MPPDDDKARLGKGKAGKRLWADIDGRSLQAAVRVYVDDDVGRENRCRYVLRHPISLQHLSAPLHIRALAENGVIQGITPPYCPYLDTNPDTSGSNEHRKLCGCCTTLARTCG